MTRTWLWIKVLYSALLSRTNQQFYDRISSIYDDVFIEHRTHAVNITNLLDSFPNISKVLDLGSGTGMLSHMLFDRNYEVVGIDISLDSLRLLRQRQPEISAIESEASHIPFMDSTIDAVVSLGAWRHFDNTELVLSEISRVLLPHGVLIIGYFPPALAGSVHSSKGIWGKLLVSVYGYLVNNWGYVDHTERELESNTINLCRKFFQEVNTASSGGKWSLIIASRLKSQPVNKNT